MTLAQPSSADPQRPSWLEEIEGDAPILLIAPHGGRAGSRDGRALEHPANPKVNDLHTVEITRELARRLGAAALINHGMDRNRLDCNRISQVLRAAPYLMEQIVARLSPRVRDGQRVIVLLIHGWNIIEPRLDLGLGGRHRGGQLLPSHSSCVSASDSFINGPLVHLAARLSAAGINTTFGYRYPASAADNLLQALTTRFADSQHPLLARLAELSASGLVEAAQLELSVAVRWPGAIRERAIAIIADTFQPAGDFAVEDDAAAVPRTMEIIRKNPPRTALPKKPAGPPARAGIEFFDPHSRLGGMASFDFGPNAMGARIMLLDGRRAILFTAEGAARREPGRIFLGPLAMEVCERGIRLTFSGPAMITPDASVYYRIEQALQIARLDENVRLELHLSSSNSLGAALAQLFESAPPAPPAPAFGAIAGRLQLEDRNYDLSGVGRFGLSFSALAAPRFKSRQMVWARSAADELGGLEIRSVRHEQGTLDCHGAVYDAAGATACAVSSFSIVAGKGRDEPEAIAATVELPGRGICELAGEAHCVVPLMRPGAGNSRISTTMGFATFTLGQCRAAGMFEYSEVHQLPPAPTDLFE